MIKNIVEMNKKEKELLKRLFWKLNKHKSEGWLIYNSQEILKEIFHGRYGKAETLLGFDAETQMNKEKPVFLSNDQQIILCIIRQAGGKIEKERLHLLLHILSKKGIPLSYQFYPERIIIEEARKKLKEFLETELKK